MQNENKPKVGVRGVKAISRDSSHLGSPTSDSAWNRLKELPIPFLFMSFSMMNKANSALPARTADNTL
jgi:hypothetical protein